MVTNRRAISRLAINEGDRQLRRSAIRFGEEIREIRLRTGVSQAAVARAIGVSRSVVCRMEQGDPAIAPRTRARSAAALGADFRIALYPGARPVIHDAAHAQIVEAVLKRRHPSWRATVESPVPGPGRRSTDLRLERDDQIILMEIESHVRGLEAIIRAGAEKRAAVVTMTSGKRVHVALVLASTRHHRALVAAHPAIVAAVLPASDGALARALASEDLPWPGDGILWQPRS